jgi:NYN domain
MIRTYVYIDGFNLYYGAVRGTDYKWLNLSHLCGHLLPRHDILAIRYFTARIRSRPHDPDAPTRQQMYLRALGTLPNLTIHFGQFLTHPVWMPDATSSTNPPKMLRVLKTEEKGSDVNLATYLLLDGFHQAYDTAVLITNDSDLLEPIKVARSVLNRKVGILCPNEKASWVLRPPTVDFLKRIRTGVLASSQFPTQLSDGAGKFQKPKSW